MSLRSRVIQVSPNNVIYTRGIDGATRAWGCCDRCGHIEELSAFDATRWSAMCDTCKDETAVAQDTMRMYGVPRT